MRLPGVNPPNMLATSSRGLGSTKLERISCSSLMSLPAYGLGTRRDTCLHLSETAAALRGSLCLPLLA